MVADPDPAKAGNLESLSLGAAAKVAGISQPTLRKHLKAGRLEATKDAGTFGNTWRIAPDVLAAFVAAQYGREIDLSDLAPKPQKERPPQDSATTESAVELHQRLEATLLELGKYKALVESAEAADKRVEAIMGARIAELQQERDAARDELEQLQARGWWGRLFGK
jgi:hypothetical protein